MGKFEQSWREAFEGAEFAPADSVWININRDLAAAEGETMKKRIVLYQRIAAASVLFALLIGAFGIYRWNESDDQLAQNKSLENSLPPVNNGKNIVDKKDLQASSTLTDKVKLSLANKGVESSNKITSTKSSSHLSSNTSKMN